MNSRPTRTIFWRHSLTLIGLQTLLALLFGFWAFREIRDIHFSQFEERLDAIVALVCVDLDSFGELPVSDSMQTRLDSLAAAANVRLAIIAQDGSLLADTHPDAVLGANHFSRPEIAASIMTGRGAAVRDSLVTGESSMYVARQVFLYDAPITVRASIPLTSIDADLDGFIHWIGLAGLLVIVASLTLIFVHSRRLSVRVRSIAEGARKFASGNLSYRIARPPMHELAILSDALNEMAGQLSSRLEAVQMQQQEQKAIFQSMSSGVIALDPTHRILNLNLAAERMLRNNAANVRGRLLHEVVRQPELHKFVAAVFDEPQGESIELETTGVEPRTLKVRVERLSAIGGAASGVVVVIDDITQLRRLETMRSDFAANVSHELRTPITNIKGYAETLLEVGFDDRTQAERFLRIIRDSSNRLAAIIDDIMALTSLEQPRMAQILEKRPTRLFVIIRSVLEQLDAEAEAKQIRVTSDTAQDLLVYVHGQLMEQAIGNLISNAIKYSPTGTSVTVTCSRLPNGEVEIAVADEGPGIPEEHRLRIFERFYRVDKARSREMGGTGLGLAIVKHIVQAHEGRITVDSNVGRGSIFRIVLPSGSESHNSAPPRRMQSQNHPHV